jgi:hypothetical protein
VPTVEAMTARVNCCRLTCSVTAIAVLPRVEKISARGHQGKYHVRRVLAIVQDRLAGRS